MSTLIGEQEPLQTDPPLTVDLEKIRDLVRCYIDRVATNRFLFYLYHETYSLLRRSCIIAHSWVLTNYIIENGQNNYRTECVCTGHKSVGVHTRS